MMFCFFRYLRSRLWVSTLSGLPRSEVREASPPIGSPSLLLLFLCCSGAAAGQSAECSRHRLISLPGSLLPGAEQLQTGDAPEPADSPSSPSTLEWATGSGRFVPLPATPTKSAY